MRNYKYYKAFYDYKKHSWILDGYFKDSRTRVIGKAIGDCVAGEGYFEHKKAADIITFEKTLPELYKPENWNAVILYNYVHEAINGDNLSERMTQYSEDISNVKEVLKNKLKRIKAYYEDYCEKHIKNDDEKSNRLLNSLENNLNDAVNDIQKYVDALKLNECLFEFRQCKPKDKLAPHLVVRYDDVGEVANVFSDIVLTDEEDESKSYSFRPDIRCYNNQLCIVRLEYEERQWGTDSNNRITRKEGDTINIKDLDELKKKGKLLLERLKRLVEIPTKELWNEWHKEDKK